MPIINNWRISPYNRWAFHHVSEFIPTIGIEKEACYSKQFKSGSKTINKNLIEPLLEETETDGIVVLHKGEIVYESYAHGNGEQTPHILMSATKSVIGLIAGILEHKGEIDLNSTVSACIPVAKGTLYQDVTLRQLLDMRAGILLNEEQQIAYGAATNWEPVPQGTKQTGLHEFFTGLMDAGETTNNAFRYISANTDLLGLAIESVTGSRITSILSDLLWKPMGAENEAYLTVDVNRDPRSTGGLCATARDFAKIGQLMIDGYDQNSNGIIPAAVIYDIVNNGNHEAWDNGQWGKSFAPISTNMCYRSGWYVINDQPQILFAMGVYGQYLFVDRINNIVIAKFSSWKEALDYKALALTHQLVEKIRGFISRLN
jgi:CubicO group peptidase (beta-lactamase class C family)